MRYQFLDTLPDEGMTERDWPDKEAKNLADDAEAFNRSYRTITTEQANDLTRALSAINAALARIEQ